MSICFINMQVPAIGTFGSSNITVGTSIGDRAAPVPAMVGLVSVMNRSWVVLKA